MDRYWFISYGIQNDKTGKIEYNYCVSSLTAPEWVLQTSLKLNSGFSVFITYSEEVSKSIADLIISGVKDSATREDQTARS